MQRQLPPVNLTDSKPNFEQTGLHGVMKMQAHLSFKSPPASLNDFEFFTVRLYFNEE